MGTRKKLQKPLGGKARNRKIEDDKEQEREDDEDKDEESEGEEKEDENEEFDGYLKELRRRRQAARSSGLTGVPTGLPQLDAATGGLQDGITILAGVTGSGKTSLALQTVLATLTHDATICVVYFLIDNVSKDEFLDQLVCQLARVDHEEYLRNKLGRAPQERVDSALRTLRKSILPRLSIVTQPMEDEYGMGLSDQRIRSEVYKLLDRCGAQRSMIVVDMLSDMPLPHLRPGDDPSQEYRRILRRINANPDQWRLQQLVEVNQKLVCPILVIAKLRKRASSDDEPEVDDLLGSVDLAYKAKCVLFLAADKPRAPHSSELPATLILKKGRFAKPLRLRLLFHFGQFRFEESFPGKNAEAKAKDVAKPVAATNPSSDPLGGKRKR